MRRLRLFILLFILAVLAICRYYTLPVSVDVAVAVQCDATGHDGARVIRKYSKQEEVSRWRAGHVARTVTEHTICQPCAGRIEQEAERQRREAERQAQAQREVEQIRSTLQARFGVDHPGVGHYWDDNSPGSTVFSILEEDKKMRPGEQLAFWFAFKNNSDKPIPPGAVKAIVRPTRYLRWQVGTPSATAMERAAQARETQESRAALAALGKEGCDVSRILPYHSTYYPTNTRASFAIGSWNTNMEDGHVLNAGRAGTLVLDPGLQPGQTIEFEGVLRVKGAEIPIGTARVDVAYGP